MQLFSQFKKHECCYNEGMKCQTFVLFVLTPRVTMHAIMGILSNHAPRFKQVTRLQVTARRNAEVATRWL
jgi:hypothetical protein